MERSLAHLLASSTAFLAPVVKSLVRKASTPLFLMISMPASTLVPAKPRSNAFNETKHHKSDTLLRFTFLIGCINSGCACMPRSTHPKRKGICT